MACNPKLGTFLGEEVKYYHSGKPQVADMVFKHETLEVMLWDGHQWHTMDQGALPINGAMAFKPNLSDEYLEDRYPELKKLKEAYEEERDKLKVFEILKIDETA